MRSGSRCHNGGCLGFVTLKCTQCKVAGYCSVPCAKTHWKTSHKQECKPVPPSSLTKKKKNSSSSSSSSTNNKDEEEAEEQTRNEEEKKIGEKEREESQKFPRANILHMPWKANQVFKETDDPDRMSVVCNVPEWVLKKSPSEQRVKLSAYEVHLPWVKDSDYFAMVVDNILTSEECASLIEMSNTKGYTPALLNVGGGAQSFSPHTRLGWRCIIDSIPWTSYLLGVLDDILPKAWKNGRLRDLNERCRFLYYDPGQEFAAHCDGRYPRPRGHANMGDVSKLTVQLYLNDVPEQNGGATTFLDDMQEKRIPCQPQLGRALIFSQDLLHEGSRLTRGYKYTMRTDVMYAPVLPAERRAALAAKDV